MILCAIVDIEAEETKADGSRLSKADFAKKDVFIDVITIPEPDTNYAMFVPNTFSVTVKTAWGDVLHTNGLSAPHGKGTIWSAASERTGNKNHEENRLWHRSERS